MARAVNTQAPQPMPRLAIWSCGEGWRFVDNCSVRIVSPQIHDQNCQVSKPPSNRKLDPSLIHMGYCCDCPLMINSEDLC
jgi:hypothetical protein